MNEFLSGIIEAALSYASPLPVTPDASSGEPPDKPDVEFSELNTHNDGTTHSEPFINPKDGEFLSEFDAYSVPLTDTTQANEARGSVISKSDINSNVENPYAIQNDHFCEDVSISSQRRQELTSGPDGDAKTKEHYIEGRINNLIKASLSSSSEIIKTSTLSKRKHEQHNNEQDNRSVLNLTTPVMDIGAPRIGDTDAIIPSASSNSEPEVKKKRKRNREINPDRTPPPQVLPPCRVCDEKSSGFHYGANTCEACKGFFRRTLKKKEVLFQCKCTEEEKGAWRRGPYKNGCPACRYERCLAIGMSKNAIKIGRYTLNRKTENIKEVKELEAIDDVIKTAISEAGQDSNSDVASPMSFIDSLSQDSPGQISTINTSVLTPLTTASSSSCDSPMTLPQNNNSEEGIKCLPSPELTLKEIDTIVKTLVDAHEKYKIMEPATSSREVVKAQHSRCLERYTLKKAIFGNTTLSNSEYIEFFKTTGMQPDDRVQQIHKALDFFQSRIALMVGFAKCVPGFSQLTIDDQANLIKESRVENFLIGGYRVALERIDYENKVLVTPWGQEYHMDEIEPIFPKEFILRRYNLAREMEKLDMTTQEESVMRAIVIFSPDRCQLKFPEKAEQIQMKLISCLQHLLSVRPGGAGNKLYKVFDLLTKFREFSEFEAKFSKRRLDEWPKLFSSYHLLSEFLR